MALAYLLSKIPQLDPTIQIKPIAFVVNHNARPESGFEAEFVGKQLRTHSKALKAKKGSSTDIDLEIESRILHMRWPEGINPLNLPDFEMRARSLRYQLIAKAAINEQIQHLFLGHHLDDQIETVMMRLVRNTSFSFLAVKGMTETSKIPCCENIRGANETIDFATVEEHFLQGQAPQQFPGSTSSATSLNKPVGISDPYGGLQLHRPLLEFSKSQLIDTCQQHNIQYVSDQTNFDPTLTMRNAIRHMRANYSLPRALQATSMLDLMKSARDRSEALEIRANLLLAHFKIIEFDLRVGSMIIQLPKDFSRMCENDIEAASHALSTITTVISAMPRDETRTRIPQARCLEFIAMLSSIPVSKDIRQNPDVGGTDKGAQIQIQQTQIQQLVNPSSLGAGYSRWRLSRPTMHNEEVKAAEQEFELESEDSKEGLSGTWSKWILWDHRYWIRVKSQIATNLRHIAIRNFRKEDMYRISKNFLCGKHFKSRLAVIAPGKMRWTLPVLTLADKASVFPTLDIRVRNSASSLGERVAHPPILDWEICYRVIDTPFIQAQKSEIVWKNTTNTSDNNQTRHLVRRMTYTPMATVRKIPWSQGGGQATPSKRR